MTSSFLSQKVDRRMKANPKIMNLMEKELKSCRSPLGQSAAKNTSSAMTKKLSTTALKNKPEAVTVVSNLSKNHKVPSQINSATAITKCDKRVKVRKFFSHHNSVECAKYDLSFPFLYYEFMNLTNIEKFATSSK
jgi:hypothetical protein